MAAKDADIARDFSHDFLYMGTSTASVARFEAELATGPKMVDGDRIEELVLVGSFAARLEIELQTTPHSTGLGSGTYRMRGFDTNGSVNGIVYWNSAVADSAAEDYTGSAGPVVNIIISDIIGD